MKKLLIILLYLFWAQNANALCEKNNIEINIKVRPGKVIYDSNYSRNEFGKLVKGPVSPNTLGLTVSNMIVAMTGETYAKPEGQRFCVGLKSITFTIGYEQIMVYIDKKYPRNSCNYNVIKEHEDYHVDVSQQALKFFRPDIEKELRKAVANLRPEYAYSAERGKQIRDKQFKQIQERIKPLRQHINLKIAEKNYLIDTPHSYQETTKKCPKW